MKVLILILTVYDFGLRGIGSNDDGTVSVERAVLFQRNIIVESVEDASLKVYRKWGAEIKWSVDGIEDFINWTAPGDYDYRLIEIDTDSMTVCEVPIPKVAFNADSTMVKEKEQP